MNRLEMALKRPFKASQIKWRKGPNGPNGRKELAYIDARDVMNRLDEVFGVNGWQTEFDFIGGRMMCKLSVRWYDEDGSINEDNWHEWICKTDGADDSNIEGAKGGISDSLKRAAVSFGIGRYLYSPSAFNGNKEPAEWATPEGFDELMAKREEEKGNK